MSGIGFNLALNVQPLPLQPVLMHRHLAPPAKPLPLQSDSMHKHIASAMSKHKLILSDSALFFIFLCKVGKNAWKIQRLFRIVKNLEFNAKAEPEIDYRPRVGGPAERDAEEHAEHMAVLHNQKFGIKNYEENKKNKVKLEFISDFCIFSFFIYLFFILWLTDIEMMDNEINLYIENDVSVIIKRWTTKLYS